MTIIIMLGITEIWIQRFHSHTMCHNVTNSFPLIMKRAEDAQSKSTRVYILT